MMHAIKKSMTLAIVERLLGCDPYAVKLSYISRRADALSRTHRKRLLSYVDRALQEVRSAALERERIGLVKTMLALLPDSSRMIQRWVIAGLPGASEVQFTIFCYLDQVAGVRKAKEFAAAVPSLVEKFLMEVPSDSGRAAWMAGDFLGDHWPLKNGLPLLIEVAKEGRFVAGRAAALHGLAHAYARASLPVRQRISEELKCIRQKDRSHRVRRISDTILGGKHLCSIDD